MARMAQVKEVELVSDSELVGVARGGDTARLGLLLERHRGPLYGLALRFFGHGQQAER
jgi:hypothetical protein